MKLCREKMMTWNVVRALVLTAIGTLAAAGCTSECPEGENQNSLFCHGGGGAEPLETDPSLEDEADPCADGACLADAGAGCASAENCKSGECSCADATCSTRVCTLEACDACTFSADGTSCDGVMESSEWGPSAAEICNGETYVQAGNCGDERAATGEKVDCEAIEETFDTPGEYEFVVPEGVVSLEVEVQGGGGGGGGGTEYYGGGGGGGAGGHTILHLPVVQGQTFAVVVGAGGARGRAISRAETDGGPTSGRNAQPGGLSSFVGAEIALVANGGARGSGGRPICYLGGSQGAGGAGGEASGGESNSTGIAGSRQPTKVCSGTPVRAGNGGDARSYGGGGGKGGAASAAYVTSGGTGKNGGTGAGGGGGSSYGSTNSGGAAGGNGGNGIVHVRYNQ